jgi:hypothetical protein
MLERLLPRDGHEELEEGSDFVSPDLVRLFRGHALEQVALGDPAAVQQSTLEAARAEYEGIQPKSPIRFRARLSLAGNTYLRALGAAPSCRPGTVHSRDLEEASSTLRSLSDDRAFTEIGRLKALVNLAQVEHCRVTAGLVADDGTVERAVQRVRASQDGVAVKELQALAASIAAERLASRGDLDAAISTIKAAIALEPSSLKQALWRGRLASWSLSGLRRKSFGG